MRKIPLLHVTKFFLEILRIYLNWGSIYFYKSLYCECEHTCSHPLWQEKWPPLWFGLLLWKQPSLGVAYPGLHGYSFHGPFRVLYHGIAQQYFPTALQNVPHQFSVAMWSRDSSFTSIVWHSAYYQHKNNAGVCFS